MSLWVRGLLIPLSTLMLFATVAVEDVAFEVDAGRHVVVDGVGDDPLARDGHVVDAVVAVVVRDVVVDQRVVRAGVRLDAGVLVVVRDVAVDRVPDRL